MSSVKILFILNAKSGTAEGNFRDEIEEFFREKKEFSIDFFMLDWDKDPVEELKVKLNEDYGIYVASGGDGTVKFVAENLYGSNKILGILPTGSANGMAKNLEIPTQINKALEVIAEGHTQPVSSLEVNGRFCFHLADIGLNASIVKRFEEQKVRGILGYAAAMKNVVFRQKPVQATIQTENTFLNNKFYMLVFCNGTGYGTGLAINPDGRMDDFQFELVSVHKLSFIEGMRLYFGQDKPRPEYAKIISCRNAEVKLAMPVHLQIDGEYLGKTSLIRAKLNPFFIQTIVPKKA